MDFWSLEDSQVRLPDNALFDPDDPPQPNPETLARWVREVRGGILAGAFYLERNMNIAIECFILGELHGRGVKSEVFGEALLSALNFDRRMKAAILVAEHIHPDEIKELRAGLNEIRVIRNAMAHNPCWFSGKPDGDFVVRQLHAFIQKGKETVHLTGGVVDEWNGLMRRMIDMTDRLARKTMDPQND